MSTDETTVVPEPGFTPEPVPDNIADTELNGLKPAEASTDETQAEATQDETQQDQPQAEDAEAEDDKAEETDTKPEAEDAQTTEDNENGEPETPEQLDAKEQARQAFEQRQAQKAQRDFINEQRAQIRQAEMEANPEDQARRLEILEAKQYVDTVERNRSGLINENAQAQATIDLFNPNNPTYNPALYTRAIQRFNDNYVITDPDTGEVLGAQDRQGNNVSLYQYLQQEAAEMSEILGNTQATSQRTAQQAEARMRAKAVNPSNPGKVSSSGDELADLLDRIGDVPLV